jgi:hypothetical protein
MEKRGEVAFSMIVTVIIAAAVMILILLWVIPNFSELFGKTEEIADAVVDEDSILELSCKNLCAEAKRVDNQTLMENIEFCSKQKDCETVGVFCEDVCDDK